MKRFTTYRTFVLVAFFASFLVFAQSASAFSPDQFSGSGCNSPLSRAMNFLSDKLGVKLAYAQVGCSWTATSVCTSLTSVNTTFSWPSFPDPCGGAAIYDLTITGPLGGTFTIPAPLTTYTRALQPSTSYSWTVSAYGTFLSDRCVTGTATPAPSGPQPFTTPSCAITANILANGSHGPITVASGSSVNVTWTSTNATSCTVTFSDAGGSWTGISGNQTQNLFVTRTYNLNCNNGYASASDAVTVNVLAPSANILANGSHGPITVAYGASVNATWTSSNVTACTVTFSDAGGSWTGTSGNQTQNLYANRTYNLSCTGSYGPASDSVTVNVSGAPPPGAFTLSSGAVACNSVGLTWTASSGADGYRVFRNAGQIATTTALAYTDYGVSANTAYSYYIQAYNSGGTANSNTISVTTPYCPPTVNLRCNGSHGPITVPAGSTCSLTWTVGGGPATTCSASGGWSGSKSTTGGSETSAPINSPKTFTLICTGPGGSTAPLDSVTVNTTGFSPPSWIEIIPQP